MSQNRVQGIFSLFADLVKLRLTLAVVLSSVTGYYLCHGTTDIRLLTLSAGVFLLASGSAILNQFTERKTDAMMERTMNRAIPAGRVTENAALGTSLITLTAGSFVLMLNGIIPLLLGLSTVVLYNFIYTRLKKITTLAIIPGGLVGAIPPMIGFSSAGGNFLNSRILAFSAFMFLWQLPHFWLIIIKYGKDYTSAGFPNLSKFLNEFQIRNLVFTWVVISTAYLFIFLLLSEPFNRAIIILLAMLNTSFISSFYIMLFRGKAPHEIRSAFILINSFSLCIMVFLITLSVLGGI